MDYQLKVFIQVVEQRSFTKAAETLFVTQSAISLQIKALEEKYGVKLIDRKRNPIRPTKGGEVLYDYAKKISNEYAKIQEKINEVYYGVQGKLAIGSSYTFGEFFLPHILVNFLNKYPKIEPNIAIRNSKRISELLLRHEIDIGILERQEPFVNLSIEPVIEDELVVILPANHPLANKGTIDLKELMNERWILREKGSGTREMTNFMFSKIGVEPKQYLEFGSSQLIKEAVQRGLGISIMSRLSIVNKVNVGVLKCLQIHENVVKRNIYIATRRDQSHTKIMDLFIEYLQKESSFLQNTLY
ncbi:MAG TPA: LysR family transcriptional regulator [Bacillota bacterium]|nr:LysR family transcriptional regulator [Bacillota bacterium]